MLIHPVLKVPVLKVTTSPCQFGQLSNLMYIRNIYIFIYVEYALIYVSQKLVL